MLIISSGLSRQPHTVEVCMVENVESFGAKLRFYVLANFEVLEERDIRALQPGTTNRGSRSISRRACGTWWADKCRRIEPLAKRCELNGSLRKAWQFPE